MARISRDENILIKAWDSKERDWHDHPYFELTYVTKGVAVHEFKNQSEIIKKGNYIIIDFNTVHRYKSINNADFEVLNCLFFPEFIDRSVYKCQRFNDLLDYFQLRFTYSKLTTQPTNHIFFDEDNSIYSILSSMYCEYNRKSAGYLEFIRCGLMQIMIYLMRQVNSTVKQISSHQISDTIIDIIRNHYTEDLLLSDIAPQLHYSVPYLSKKFHEETGQSFRDYIISFRIKNACVLLANTDFSIADVAYMVGYRDIKTFFNNFKRVSDTTPNAFRKQIKTYSDSLS